MTDDLRQRMTWAFRLGFPLTVMQLVRMLDAPERRVSGMAQELAQDGLIWPQGWHKGKRGRRARLWVLSPAEAVPSGRWGAGSCR